MPKQAVGIGDSLAPVQIMGMRPQLGRNIVESQEQRHLDILDARLGVPLAGCGAVVIVFKQGLEFAALGIPGRLGRSLRIVNHRIIAATENARFGHNRVRDHLRHANTSNSALHGVNLRRHCLE